MENCLLCPKGVKCRGYKLHLMLLKLYDLMEVRGKVDDIVRELSREDMMLLAEQGAEARKTCWSKCFVLSVGRKLANFAAADIDDQTMRRSVEHLIVQMDSLFAKLPKGININIMDLSMEVFNQACIDLEESGSKGVLPSNILGQAFAAQAKKRGMG